MFHEYLGNLYDEELNAVSPAFYGLGLLQNEGIADLVDKDRPEDTVDDPNISEVVFNSYMETFNDTPAMLEKFDRQTVAYLEGRIEKSDLYRYIYRLIPFDGHANGHFMTLVIQRQGLLPALLENVADPVHFAKVYNMAAAAEGSYVFSDEFMAHLEEARKYSGPNAK